MLLIIVFCRQIPAQIGGNNNRMNFCLKKNVWKKKSYCKAHYGFINRIYLSYVFDIITDICGFVTLCTSVNLSGVRVGRSRSMTDEDIPGQRSNKVGSIPLSSQYSRSRGRSLSCARPAWATQWDSVLRKGRRSRGD